MPGASVHTSLGHMMYTAVSATELLGKGIACGVWLKKGQHLHPGKTDTAFLFLSWT